MGCVGGSYPCRQDIAKYSDIVGSIKNALNLRTDYNDLLPKFPLKALASRQEIQPVLDQLHYTANWDIQDQADSKYLADFLKEDEMYSVIKFRVVCALSQTDLIGIEKYAKALMFDKPEINVGEFQAIIESTCYFATVVIATIALCTYKERVYDIEYKFKRLRDSYDLRHNTILDPLFKNIGESLTYKNVCKFLLLNKFLLSLDDIKDIFIN